MRVTYTLPKKTIENLSYYSKKFRIPKSQIVSTSISNSFEFMDCYEDIGEVSKKIENTLPQTFTIDDEVGKRFNYFSEELKFKKSHIVSDSLSEYFEILRYMM